MSNSLSLEQSQNAFLSVLLCHGDNEECNVCPIERLTVYQENHKQALHSALNDTYPLTLSLLKELKDHDGTLASYVKGYPSTDENLNLYGASFSEFLRKNNQDKMLVDLANYEYQRLLCYYANNSPQFPLEYFDTMSLESKLEQGFIKQKSIIAVKCGFNLLNFIGNDKLPDALIEQNYVLYREMGKVKIKLIEKDEYGLLEKFKHPHSLKTLCEHELSLLPNFIARNWLMMVESKA